MPLISDPAIWFKELFIQVGLSNSIASFLSTIALVVIVIFISWLVNLIAKAIILKVVTNIVKKTTTTWDDIFLEQKVFSRLSHFAPILVIWFMAGWALKAYPVWMIFVHKLAYIYIVLVGTVFINSFIESWHEIYKTLPLSRHRHIKGYVQILKIFVILVASLVIISVLFQKDISSILAGLGAIAAVLILVFRDTLLGLVASIQLSADKMLKVGDRISIPRREVDGVVTDITLNTVKIENFDKTITTVPTYSLVNDSFQNWKGVESAGVRQLKRLIFIDIRSISFLNPVMTDRLKKVPVLRDYIESLEKQIDIKTAKTGENEAPFFVTSPITNLGIFRFYIETYLRQHPLIDATQAINVIHKIPAGDGLQLQMHAFTKQNQFRSFENIQSEIVEHSLAILNEFGLKVFQVPTGDDILSLLKTK